VLTLWPGVPFGSCKQASRAMPFEGPCACTDMDHAAILESARISSMWRKNDDFGVESASQCRDTLA